MSEPNKILLFGKNGQVGYELQQRLKRLGHVIALGVDSADYCGDFSRPQDVIDSIEAIRPDVVVNAAAYTAVDKAESEPDLAFKINAETPGLIAEVCEKLDAWFVHYSTDYVFDGSGSAPWNEWHTPAPINIYGKTKLQGERLVASACRKHLILRTSWVFGVHGGNFAKTMLRLAQERDSLSVVDDQIGAPTSAALLAQLTVEVIPQLQKHPELAGLYHAAASGETSWYGYAKFVLGYAAKLGHQMKLDLANIQPVSSDQFPTPAKRPNNSRLDTHKLRGTFGLDLPEWQLGVTEMLDQIIMDDNNEKA